MKKQLLIFVDRDGTVLYDRKTQPRYYLGRQKDWKEKTKFLNGVVGGLKLIKKELPHAKIYLISNQPGIAIKDFPLLTQERVNEVFRYVLKKLETFGVRLDGYEFCGKVSPKYVKTRDQFSFDKRLVGNFDCIKPKPGMIKSILKKENLGFGDAEIYVVGDRASDVETAHNVKGFGILVPFVNQPGQNAKFKKLKNKNKHVAKNFLEAAKFIIKREG